MRASKASWLKAAETMNSIAKRLRREGMRVGYHNHMVEFKRIEGEWPWDTVFGATHPDVVMQVDTGNAMQGGVSPDDVLNLIRRYPGRAVTVHLKEFSPTNEKALIGEGKVKWKEFFSLCGSIGGTKWFIVEQEKYPFSPLESVKRCRENLKKLMT